MTITISNVDEATARWLAAEAAKRGVAENEVALQLIRKQIEAEKNLPTFHDLDHLFGTWSEQDAEEFEQATKYFS